MSRKRKSSLFEDLFELIAKLPWWLGGALAVLSYVGLHYLATAPVDTPKAANAADIASVVWPQILQVFAVFGQYLLTGICVLAALASAWRQSKRHKLMLGVASNPSLRALEEMSWQQFEMLVGESFRQQGYSVQENGGGGADGGVDLVLTKGGEKFYVQCKQWKARTVGVAIVRELFGLMSAAGVTGAFVVTSGLYSTDAKKFAAGRNIVLLDGESLKDMIDGRSVKSEGVNANHRQSCETVTIACPECGSPMIRRVARKGLNAGTAFFGCSRFPVCKGSR